MNFSMKMPALFGCFTFLALCANNILSGAMAANSVQQMTGVLGHPAWKDLKPLKIIGRNKLIEVEELLKSDAEGQNLVTAENIHRKVQQAVNFLNCDYALMFLIYVEYMASIGDICNQMTGNDTAATDKRECLKKFRRLSDRKMLVYRMQSAIVYLKSLSPKPIPVDEFSKILTSFDSAYETTPDPYWEQQKTASNRFICFGSSGEAEDVFKLKTVGTINLLTELNTKTKEFFGQHCRPKLRLYERNIDISTYTRANNSREHICLGVGSLVNCVNKTYTALNNMINDFIVLDYTRLGFVFNAQSNVTVFNENPDTGNRIRQINSILRYVGWSNHLGNLKIVMDGRQYSIQDVLTTYAERQLANEQYVDSVMRIVYRFMSCYFVIQLKELLYYSKSLAQLFDQASPIDKLECVKSFVTMTKNNDAVVLRMKSALMYFQRLSPQTGFGKHVLKIIYLLLSYIEMINDNYFESIVDEFLSYLLGVEKELDSYTAMYCVLPNSPTSNEVRQNSPKEIEQQHDRKINSFITVFTSLGLNITHVQPLE